MPAGLRTVTRAASQAETPLGRMISPWVRNAFESAGLPAGAPGPAQSLGELLDRLGVHGPAFSVGRPNAGELMFGAFARAKVGRYGRQPIVPNYEGWGLLADTALEFAPPYAAASIGWKLVRALNDLGEPDGRDGVVFTNAVYLAGYHVVRDCGRQQHAFNAGGVSPSCSSPLIISPGNRLQVSPTFIEVETFQFDGVTNLGLPAVKYSRSGGTSALGGVRLIHARSSGFEDPTAKLWSVSRLRWDSEPALRPIADPVASPDGRLIWRWVSGAGSSASGRSPHDGPFGASMRPHMRWTESKRLSSRAAARFAHVVMYNAATEFRDLVRSLWKSIDAKDRKYWGNPTLWRMTFDIVTNLKNVHLTPWYEQHARLKGGKLVVLKKAKAKPGAFWEIGANGVQDAVYGSVGMLSGQAARRLQSPVDAGGRAVRAAGKGTYQLGSDPIAATLDAWGSEFAKSWLGAEPARPPPMRKPYARRARIN